MDPSKISIVSSKKTNVDALLIEGNTSLKGKVDQRTLSAADRAAEQEKTIKQLTHSVKKCNLCCSVAGMGIAAPMTVVLSSVTTFGYIFFEKKITYTINAAAKQIMWLAIPGVLCAGSLHFFLSEASWSGRRNTYGSAWIKAVASNTLMWSSCIGLGTLSWRVLMPKTAWGKRMYYRYMCPADTLEIRQMRNPNAFFTGMNWVYWASGMISGQIGFSAGASVGIWQNKVHYFMNPTGTYATSCLPPFRLEQMIRTSNVVPDFPKP